MKGDLYSNLIGTTKSSTMKLKNKLPDLQNVFGAMELYATE